MKNALLHTIGYEAARSDHFVGTLRVADIDVLIDIRDRAQSRRKGFSKTALSRSLEDVGIEYLHLRELGDPKPGREAARAGDWVTFERIFSEVIASDDAQAALEVIASLLRAGKRVCLLCFERDYRTCHRKIVSDILYERTGNKARHLGVREIEPIRASAGRVLHSRQSAAASF